MDENIKSELDQWIEAAKNITHDDMTNMASECISAIEKMTKDDMLGVLRGADVARTMKNSNETWSRYIGEVAALGMVVIAMREMENQAADK